MGHKRKLKFKKFVEVTEDNTFIKECFDNKEESVETLAKKWLKIFNSILFSCFDRI